MCRASSNVLTHTNGVSTDEARAAVERLDPRLGEPVFRTLRHRIRERALELGEIRPANGDALAGNALPVEAARRMDRLCGADQHLLRSHPRSAHVPPYGRESTMATFQPAARHLRATEEPAEPVPMTMRSNVMLPILFCRVPPVIR